MKIITTLTLEKRNNKGKILESFTQPSRSWTKHFFDLLYEPLWISDKYTSCCE